MEPAEGSGCSCFRVEGEDKSGKEFRHLHIGVFELGLLVLMVVLWSQDGHSFMCGWFTPVQDQRRLWKIYATRPALSFKEEQLTPEGRRGRGIFLPDKLTSQCLGDGMKPRKKNSPSAQAFTLLFISQLQQIPSTFTLAVKFIG
ncbi:hypothetical protein AGIG_G5995 [Arapaima gigas]